MNREPLGLSFRGITNFANIFNIPIKVAGVRMTSFRIGTISFASTQNSIEVGGVWALCSRGNIRPWITFTITLALSILGNDRRTSCPSIFFNPLRLSWPNTSVHIWKSLPQLDAVASNRVFRESSEIFIGFFCIRKNPHRGTHLIYVLSLYFYSLRTEN